MLNKIRGLQYQFDNTGNIREVSVSFNDYDGNLNGNLNITFTNEDGRFDLLSPKEIQAIAKQEILEELAKEPESETEEETEEKEEEAE